MENGEKIDSPFLGAWGGKTHNIHLLLEEQQCKEVRTLQVAGTQTHTHTHTWSDCLTQLPPLKPKMLILLEMCSINRF